MVQIVSSISKKYAAACKPSEVEMLLKYRGGVHNLPKGNDLVPLSFANDLVYIHMGGYVESFFDVKI
jgi:hypothetical protein